MQHYNGMHLYPVIKVLMLIVGYLLSTYKLSFFTQFTQSFGSMHSIQTTCNSEVYCAIEWDGLQKHLKQKLH